MSDDYKLGYENGRYAALVALKAELNSQKEPLLRKIISDGKSDQITGARLTLINTLDDWITDEMEKTE
ncbi:hypothetical protein [Pediococcus pentosaceus]|uniref:hypothetical protein n=1 Tax=Pediococcus pentosaceus TaxID=1255 RepID=UPI000C08B1F7|nr:hypothetical protein [Pediococcus pentosaceus]